MNESPVRTAASKGGAPARVRAALVRTAMAAAFFAVFAPAAHQGAGRALAAGGRAPMNVSPDEARNLVERGAGDPDFVILDVRTESEFRDGRIPRAVNLDFNSGIFREEADKLDKGKTYLVYCRSGNRSWNAVLTMNELGFERTYNMTSGFVEWRKKGFPVEQ